MQKSLGKNEEKQERLKDKFTEYREVEYRFQFPSRPILKDTLLEVSQNIEKGFRTFYTNYS